MGAPPTGPPGPPTTGGYGGPGYPGAPGGYGGPGMMPGATNSTQDAHLASFLKEVDIFNSPKEFVRASVGRMPNSVSAKQKTCVPLGFVLQPLAPERHDEVPSVNHGAVGSIIRCKSCRTYINPFVQWEANGRRWTCNLCGFSQATPDTYYSNLDETGKRADRYEKPELCKGAVEYIAPAEYMVRPPQPPVFMFVIDVSASAVQTGMLHAVVEGIKQAITSQAMPGGQRLQIGIITYDTSLHFYNLNPNLSTPQMLVVSDLEDLFLPLPDDILVHASESEAKVLELLDSLPLIFQDTQIKESCMGSAVKGAFLAMKHIGGKLLVFGSCIPSVGEFSLKSTRDNPQLLGRDKEVELLRPVNGAYKELANELTRAQISVELFMGPNAYVDLASIAPLAASTGGDLRYYKDFHTYHQGTKLRSELLHVLSRYMGWEAVMRVRVSRGWKPVKFYGHLFIRGVDLLVVPNCHADQTFAVTIDLEENATPDPIICIQSALLYTNSEGERRIRVHTWAAATTQNYQDITQSIDVQATTTLLSHINLDHSKETNLPEGRNKLNSFCQQIVQAGNTVQCEALQFLPLYIMGMLKSPAFRGGAEIQVDQRTFIWSRLETLTVSQLVAYYYPRLLALHNISDKCGVPDENGHVLLPDMLNLTSESMQQDGMYLLEDGEVMMLWIGRAVDSNILQAVFAAPSFEQLDIAQAEATLGTQENPFSEKVRNIIKQIQVERPVPYMQPIVIKGGEGGREMRFFASLIEDRTPSMNQTYMEFLHQKGYRPQNTQAPPSQGMGPPMGMGGPPQMGGPPMR